MFHLLSIVAALYSQKESKEESIFAPETRRTQDSSPRKSLQEIVVRESMYFCQGATISDCLSGRSRRRQTTRGESYFEIVLLRFSRTASHYRCKLSRRQEFTGLVYP